MKKLIAFLVLSVTVSLSAFAQTTVVINEVNADNPGGADTREFVELYGTPNGSLNGFTLVFCGGSTSTYYYAIDLSPYSLNQFGFFVAGNALTTNVDVTFANALLQNGPDAVALYNAPITNFPNGGAISTNNLVDAAVYGTGDAPSPALIAALGLNTIAGYTPFDETVQASGSADLTQSRVPDGGTPLENTSYVLQALTPGTWNSNPCIAGTPVFLDDVSPLILCDNIATSVAMDAYNGLGNGFFVAVDSAQNIVSIADVNFIFEGASASFNIYSVGYTGTLDSTSIAVGSPLSGIIATECVSISTSSLSVSLVPCSGCSGAIVSSDIPSNGIITADATPDVFNLFTTSISNTDTYDFALLDNSGAFIQWLTASFDFNTLTPGIYQIAGVSYEGTLSGDVSGAALNTIVASTCIDISTNTLSFTVLGIPSVVINEVNSDNIMTVDTQEFIELFGNANEPLTGLCVVLIDGTTLTTYNAFDLDNYSTDANGFFVLGEATVSQVDYVFPNVQAVIQNGADAVAIYIGNANQYPNGSAISTLNLVDAVVYGTADLQNNSLIAALGLNTVSGYTQFDETAQTVGTDLTISRIPDGGSAFTTNYVIQALTPGTWNSPPCSAGTVALADGSSSVSFCTNQSTVIDFNAFNGTGTGMILLTDSTGVILQELTSTTYDFNAIVGTYNIYSIGYTGTLDAASVQVGANIFSAAASQCISISTTFISVTITTCIGCEAGIIGTTNGATNTTVYLNSSADVLGLTTSSASTTATYAYALTDITQHFIQWVPANFDFNTLSTGIYLVYGVSYEGALTEPLVGALISTATAANCISWTPNFIYINTLTVAEVVINELNADNPGGNDTQEFVELYGEANASLDNLVIVFYGGSTGGSYAAFDLDGYSTDENGFFVLGDTLTTNVDYMITSATLQNGADGVALFVGNGSDFPNTTPPTTTNLIDVMIYGTDDAPATSLITGFGLDVMFPGYAQFNETVQAAGEDLTQSRIPDGGPALSNYNVALQALTPGTFNVNVSVQEIEGFDQLVLFPNPTSNNFNIQWNSNSNEFVQMRMTDITGKVVYQNSHAVTQGMNTIEIDAQSWASGYYMIEMEVNNTIGRMKLVKN
jgi:hypothetical protein